MKKPTLPDRRRRAPVRKECGVASSTLDLEAPFAMSIVSSSHRDPQAEHLDALERAVPPDLRGVPGIPRDLPTERFFAREYPLSNWQARHASFMRLKRKAHEHIIGPFKPTIRTVRGSAFASHRRNPSPNPIVEADLTASVREKALELGFALVGFTDNDRKYVYREYRRWVRFDTAIVGIVEMDHAATQKAPLPDAERAGYLAQVRWTEIAFALAEFIRSRGYRVQVHSPFHPTEILQHYVVQAGLGQMGANGQSLSPSFGSRCRMSLLTTDAPLSHDRPRDFGIPKFCDICQVCVSRCPGRALSRDRITFRGITKHKAVPELCGPILVMYNNCSICVKTCPVQKYGYEAVMDHYRATGEVLGKGSDDLEAYELPDKGIFLSGQRPTFERQSLIQLKRKPSSTEGEG